MASIDGERELIKAIRSVLITNATLSAAGIYYRKAPREAPFRYIVLDIQTNRPNHGLGRRTHYRDIDVMVKACGKESSGKSGYQNAGELLDLAMPLLTQVVSATNPEDRINTYLVPLGFRAMIPMIGQSIPAYDEKAGGDRDATNTTVWHLGYYVHYKIEAV